ncbi:response regulator [Roseovarius spongiae]|uniref:DNA-binding transcriptional regulator NtrC n=1 Tax=Roseovarius spongiae TaxID=2320272 RepID=A0A3A8AVM2_9RHOB|nr:response regulator [Roseovarius spongiae]RKF15188.1 response regulator [Roseovarius spongiae]
MDGTVLVADDDRTIRTVLTQALTRAGCRVHATSSLTTLMRWVGEGLGDAVISDVAMPDGNGLEMLPAIADKRPGLPVIVISAQNTIMTAIRAAEVDAFDYLPKPFDLPDLMKRVARALDARRAPGARAAPATERPEELPLIGRSEAMQQVYRLAAQVVNADMPLLITGESGTGKSLIARALHDLSDRRALPFVAVTPLDLRDAEASARVLARAGGGAVLLEEVAEFDADAQGHIVRMMEVPIEAAPRFIATGRFDAPERVRDDLYHRLSGALLDMPPLRARRDDIPLLIAHFLGRAAADGLPKRRMSDAALDMLRARNWPGNVRELENTVRRAAMNARAEEIGCDDIAPLPTERPPARAPNDGETLSETVAQHLRRYFDLHDGMPPAAGLYGRILREVELPLIEIALDATGGNQAKCAELLGMNRNTLRKKMSDLDIRVTRRRKLM